MKPAGITTPGCRPPLLSACVPRHNPCSPANNALFSGLSPLSRLKARTFSLTIRATGDTNQGNSDGLHHIKTLRSAYVSTVTKAILNFTSSNFLPIALISAVALGIANPTPGCLAHKFPLSKFSTSGIFFISGLKLQGKEFRAVAEAWPAGIFGLASILLLSPFFSRLILQVPLAHHDFVTGLAIFSCMPTTLSSGVALTQLAGGNSSLALAMTVVSNLLGIVTVPSWISQFWGDGYGVTIPTRELFWSLIFTLLIPLALGKATAGLDEWFNFIIFIMFVDLTHIAGILNPFPLTGLATYIDQNQRISTMTSVILLSLTPWMQVSKSRPLLITFKPQVFFEAIGMGIAVHLTLLVFNTIAVKCMSAASGGTKSIFARKENLRALLIVCSQKALLTVVAVVEQLSGALGESGLLVLPCVAAHINQVIIDSLLVNFWLRKDQSEDKNFEA